MIVAAQIVFGLVLLVVGGELLVRGAASLAAAFKISPLVIGLTVVAFGTSAPELGVSLQAALSGSADVAIGNVVGSNIINVLLILGIAAIVAPLIVSSQLVRLDVPLMIAVSGVFWWMASDGNISRPEGILLFVALLTYIGYSLTKSRSEHKKVQDEFEEYGSLVSGKLDFVLQVSLLIGGLFLLGLGSNWLVTGAKAVATNLGISQLVIGLTVVAIGTSLPEMVTSVVASYRGQRDIAVGNVVGSNLFNILCVLGLTATVAPGGIPVSATAISFDIPIMFAVAVICLPIFFTGHLIRRWEGGLFLFFYVAYSFVIVMAATSPQLQVAKSMAYVVVPLTAISVVFSFLQSSRSSSEMESDMNT